MMLTQLMEILTYFYETTLMAEKECSCISEWIYRPGKYDDTVQHLKELVFARSSSCLDCLHHLVQHHWKKHIMMKISNYDLFSSSEPVRKKSYWMKSMEVFNVQSKVRSSVTPPTVDGKSEAGRQVDNYLSEDAIDPEKDPLLY
uniref:Uncharacterized protein n=1 Tax=Romanomermis culicivorax TaxID=13658 RepID=A0A915L4N8_ROMCU